MVDPARAALNLQKVSDRCFIQKDFATIGGTFCVLGAEFFVPENGMVAHLLEDGLHASPIWQIDLEFRTLLIFARLRRAFVCEHSLAFGGAHANQLSMLAERALRVVEQRIRFTYAPFCYMETELTQASTDFSKLVRQAELDFNFDLQSDTLMHPEGKCQMTSPSPGFDGRKGVREENRAPFSRRT